MMPPKGSDLPGGADLLLEARRTLLEELLPRLGEGDKLTALMIANALAIGSRELEATASAPPSRDAAAALAADIRGGRRDADEALHRHLLEDSIARLRISSPKALR